MVEVNLLPAQYRRRSQPNAWRYATYALLPVTALLILVPSLVVGSQLGEVQRQVDAADGEIAALTPDKREYDGLNRQRQELQQVTAVSTTLQASKSYWSTDLARFVNALPSGGSVALSSLTVRSLDSSAQTNLQQQGVYDGKPVTKEFDLTGQAASTQALVTFLHSYESNPNFGVNFKSVQRATDAASGAGAAANSAYTFNASVGLLGQPAQAAQTTPAQSTPAQGTQSAPAAPPATPGGQNVR